MWKTQQELSLALLWYELEKMEEATRSDLPPLMESDGYIFGSDHSTPSNVGLEDFRRMTDLVKTLGTYGRDRSDV
jgi:uroporphyrinogen-III decarboxylase